MSEELLSKVKKAIAQTGYPLELRVGATLRKHDWVPFHSVEYIDPKTEVLRELDILSYKLIQNRRIELRISCKSSTNKQWVCFTTPRTSHMISYLKFIPVNDNVETRREIPDHLAKLRFFSESKETINYSVLVGNNVDREGRSLLRDAIFSSLSSIYLDPIPGRLLFDLRGTIYFFLVILGGKMFEASLDQESNDMIVKECEYFQWRSRFNIPSNFYKLKINNANAEPVAFSDAMSHFGDHFVVEVVSESYLETYLIQLESVFSSLDEQVLSYFGKGWDDENFPKVVRRPTLQPVKQELEIDDAAKS